MTEKQQVSDLIKKVLDQLEHSEKKENKTGHEFLIQEISEIQIEGNFHPDFHKSNIIIDFKGKDECGFRDSQAIKLTPFQTLELIKGLQDATKYLADNGMEFLKKVSKNER